jgi:LPS O-antigen subunit length determinant protein (WzzB/FepE family)
MQKSRQTQDYEIDIAKLLKRVWKDKILIFLIVLLFTFIGYFYGVFQPKIYKVEFLIRDVPSVFLTKYSQISDKASEPSPGITHIATLFNNEFKLNLLSTDNLIIFFDQNSSIYKSNSYLKDSNIKPNIFFNKKIEALYDKNSTFSNRYSFTYEDNFLAEEFLTNYIKFVKKKTETDFKKILYIINHKEISTHEKNLEIAEKIKLENPFTKPRNDSSYDTVEQSWLFYKGTKVLSQEILHLKEASNQIKNFELDYNPMIGITTRPNRVSLSVEKFAAAGFLLGLFISLIVISARFFLIK